MRLRRTDPWLRNWKAQDAVVPESLPPWIGAFDNQSLVEVAALLEAKGNERAEAVWQLASCTLGEVSIIDPLMAVDLVDMLKDYVPGVPCTRPTIGWFRRNTDRKRQP